MSTSAKEDSRRYHRRKPTRTILAMIQTMNQSLVMHQKRMIHHQKTLQGNQWSRGDFEPDQQPQELFEEQFTTTINRSGRTTTELQVPPGYANSPIKAWRLIFTNTILERLVEEYGNLNVGKDKWSDIDQKVIIDFLRPVCDGNRIQKGRISQTTVSLMTQYWSPR